MTVQDAIDATELRAWGQPVRDLVAYLVNDQGICWRWLNNGNTHLALYPPDGVSRPFKISRSRPAEATVMWLERQFMAVYDIPGPDGTVPGAESGTESDILEAVAGPGDPGSIVAVGGAQIGSVADELLAAVAERDALKVEVLGLREACDSQESEVEALLLTVAALTQQRDDLLNKIDKAAVWVSDALGELQP